MLCLSLSLTYYNLINTTSYITYNLLIMQDCYFLHYPMSNQVSKKKFSSLKKLIALVHL